MTSILVVEDQKPLRRNLAFYLKSQGYDVDSAESGEEGLAKMEDKPFDIVISDYNMDRMSGGELMARAKSLQPSLEFIVMTAYGSIPLAVELIKGGAADFICKPFEYSVVLDSIAKILKCRQSRPAADDKDHLQIIAQSQKMKDIVDLATRAAFSDVAVLIEGEIGTGKELFARVVHRQGQRSRGDFVVVECASFPEPELEKEIFGCVSSNDSGALGRADGGVILMKDIDFLSPRTQGRLLRFLSEGTYMPTDSASVRKSNVRVVATTTTNLKQLTSTGTFREDLYYLLNVMPVYLPPLRARADDVLPLVKHFLTKYNSQSRKNVKAIAPEVLEWMNSYDWPGNVQELENVIARACVLATGEVLDESLIFTLPQDRPTVEDSSGFLNITLKDNQRSLILKVLKQNNGNFSRTALQLGISRTTLWRRLKKFKTEGLPIER